MLDEDVNGAHQINRQAGLMADYPTSFDKDDLIRCAQGDLFGPGNAQLPMPPMLMMDRITEISGDGGEHGKRSMSAPSSISRRTCGFSTATFPATRSCRAV